jgi:putative two-component system response regulator
MSDEPGQLHRILIVDDTPANIRVLGEVLSSYERFVATTGEKALERARSSTPPDLILLDVMMPGMDGFEVCRRLKEDEATRDIPVIFVTAMGEVADETEGLELGAVDYVTKPFSPSVVRARVRTHIALRDARTALEDVNVLLEEKVSQRTRQLREALTQVKEASHETILRLSRAAEFKDDSTGKHLLRMSHVAALVARAVGLDDDECELILNAAPMHDVGKIGIPDHVLLKPGSLSVEEWQVMRRHCAMGVQILTESQHEVIRLGEIVARSHHERWDGSGYPKGLAGEDIPLAGRVVAIADVFDALASRRPYKPAFSVERSLQIIREGSGAHFDPRIVEAFFSIEEEILEIHKKYRDEGR